MQLWVTSDTHFGHENIIKYCSRPFTDAHEMDEMLILYWNTLVKPEDHVYHLGDVAMAKPFLKQVKRLNGHKRLVMGNHDIFRVQDYLAAGFEKIMAMRVLDGMLFTHVPVHPESMGRFKANIHGHTHEHSYGAPYLNVCVEVRQYKPVPIEDIAKVANAMARERDYHPPQRERWL